MRARLFAAAVLCCAVAVPAAAQDPHLIVVTGVAGDEEHVAQFHKWAMAVVDAAKRFGVPDADVAYLSDKRSRTGHIRDPRRRTTSRRPWPTPRAGQPNDEVFILLSGTQLRRPRRRVHLPGPIGGRRLLELLDKLAAQRSCREQRQLERAFVQPLAGPGRTLSPTRPARTQRDAFTAYFVEAFQGDAADRDRNGRVSASKHSITRARRSWHRTSRRAYSDRAGGLDDGSEGSWRDAVPGAAASRSARRPPRIRSFVRSSMSGTRSSGRSPSCGYGKTAWNPRGTNGSSKRF